MELNDITGHIVDCCYHIHKAMGAGLYEKVYEDCLAYELDKKGLMYKRQHSIDVTYQELVIPNAFKLDLLVEDQVVVELKSVDTLLPIHQAQIITYLKLSKVETGLLINFNVPLIKDGIKRFKV